MVDIGAAIGGGMIAGKIGESNEIARDGVKVGKEANRIAEEVGKESNAIAAEGVKVGKESNRIAEEVGKESNAIAAEGVKVGEESNAIAAEGVKVGEEANRIAEEVGTEANAIAAEGVKVGEEANAIAAEGVKVGEEAKEEFRKQATDFNLTAEAANENFGQIADAFEDNSKVFQDAVALWSPWMSFILMMTGPLKILAGLNYLSLILKNLGATKAAPLSIRQLEVTNGSLENMAKAQVQANVAELVEDIAKKPVLQDRRNGEKLTIHFFYTTDGATLDRLNGKGHYAYRHLPDLLHEVYCWNAFLEAAGKETIPEDPLGPNVSRLLREQEEKWKKRGHPAPPEISVLLQDLKDKGNLKKFGNRCTKIYFLEPFDEQLVMNNIEFHTIYREVHFISLLNQKERVMLECAKIYEGCSVIFRDLTICKVKFECADEIVGDVDIESAGIGTGTTLTFERCYIGWDFRADLNTNVKYRGTEKMKVPPMWRRIKQKMKKDWKWLLVFALIVVAVVIGLIIHFWDEISHELRPTLPPTLSPSSVPTGASSTLPSTALTDVPSLSPSSKPCFQTNNELKNAVNDWFLSGTNDRPTEVLIPYKDGYLRGKQPPDSALDLVKYKPQKVALCINADGRAYSSIYSEAECEEYEGSYETIIWYAWDEDCTYSNITEFCNYEYNDFLVVLRNNCEAVNTAINQMVYDGYDVSAVCVANEVPYTPKGFPRKTTGATPAAQPTVRALQGYHPSL